MSVFVLTPNDDNTSQEAGRWGLDVATRHGLKHLQTRKRKVVESDLANHDHLLYFGHGSMDALIVVPSAFRGQVDLVDASNIGMCGGVVVAVACLAARKLGSGSALIPPGSGGVPAVQAFLGWLNRMSYPPSAPEPLRDAVLRGLDVLLHGGTVKDTRDELVRAFEDAHDIYERDGKSVFGLTSGQVETALMQATYWKDRLRLYGNGTTRVFAGTAI